MHTARTLHRWLMTAGLIAAAHAAAQTALPDPTRPPAGLPSAGTPSDAPAADAWVLQSVLINSGRPPAAVISGQLVPLGGQLGDQRLAAVTERSVQLKGPQGATTLHLMPEVHKQARPSRAEPKP